MCRKFKWLQLLAGTSQWPFHVFKILTTFIRSRKEISTIKLKSNKHFVQISGHRPHRSSSSSVVAADYLVKSNPTATAQQQPLPVHVGTVSPTMDGLLLSSPPVPPQSAIHPHSGVLSSQHRHTLSEDSTDSNMGSSCNLPPPTLSRLPPDGHEFPPDYRDPATTSTAATIVYQVGKKTFHLLGLQLHDISII